MVDSEAHQIFVFGHILIFTLFGHRAAFAGTSIMCSPSSRRKRGRLNRGVTFTRPNTETLHFVALGVPSASYFSNIHLGRSATACIPPTRTNSESLWLRACHFERLAEWVLLFAGSAHGRGCASYSWTRRSIISSLADSVFLLATSLYYYLHIPNGTLDQAPGFYGLGARGNRRGPPSGEESGGLCRRDLCGNPESGLHNMASYQSPSFMFYCSLLPLVG